MQMPDYREDINETYRNMSNDELMELWIGGNLTEVAISVARDEFRRRGFQPPEVAPVGIAEDRTGIEETVAFVTVARSLIPSELHILHARLDGDGIPSFIADDNLTQMNPLWSIAVGGARLLVRQDRAEEAKQIIDLLESGRFALRESDGDG
jgi:hypothetical protein